MSGQTNPFARLLQFYLSLDLVWSLLLIIIAAGILLFVEFHFTTILRRRIGRPFPGTHLVGAILKYLALFSLLALVVWGLSRVVVLAAPAACVNPLGRAVMVVEQQGESTVLLLSNQARRTLAQRLSISLQLQGTPTPLCPQSLPAPASSVATPALPSSPTPAPAEETPMPSATPTATFTDTPTATSSPTHTPTATATPSPSPTPTATPDLRFRLPDIKIPVPFVTASRP